MPVVKAYGPNQVAAAPKPRAYKTNAPSAESYGAGLGQQAANIGTTLLTQAVARERDKANQLAVLDGDTQLGTWTNQAVLDPQSGALTVKGKDVFGLPEKVLGDYDSVVGKIAGGLSNDDQRLAFARIAAGRRQSLQARLGDHVLSESQQYDADTTKAAIENAQSAAVASATDPARVAEELNRGATVIDQWGARNGVSADVLTQQKLGFTTSVHTGVIDRYLSTGNDTAAKVYYEETKGQISGDAQARIEKALEEGALRGQAQKASDAIVAAGGSLTDQREKARAITDPQLRDEVMSRIEHEGQVAAVEARAQDEAKMRGVYDIVDKTHSVTAIPPTIWSTLDGNDRSALRGYAKSLAGGGSVETDPATLYTLLTLSSTDPDAFMQTNLLRYTGKLSKGDLEQMMQKQASLRTGDNKGADKLFVSEQNQNTMVDDAMTSMGLNVTPTELRANKDLADKVSLFRRAVRDAVTRKESALGRKVTDDEMQSIVDTLSVRVGDRVTKTGYIWNTTEPAYAYQVGQAQVKTAAQVPAAERSKIEAALRRNGMPVNDAAILSLFNAQLAHTRGDR